MELMSIDKYCLTAKKAVRRIHSI